MKYTIAQTVSILFIFLLLIISSCKDKNTNQEKLDFTEESHDYTASEENQNVDHITFTDITKSAGIEFDHITGAFGEKWMPETIGSGGGFFDYDNDGLPDILLINSNFWPGHNESNAQATSKLYRNNGNGKFEDVSAKAGIDFPIYGMGASMADFDADGDQDIYLTAVGTNKLLRNDHGKFVDVTNQMKVSGNADGSSQAWSTGSAWIDIDRDGWLDLFVANYVKWTPETDIYTTRDGKNKSYATPDVYQGESCRLYKNIGGKTFEDITEKAGVYNSEGKSLGVAIADFNNDMWPDLVISNDTQPNFLYINNGDGTFKNMAVPYGIAYDENGRARAGMGIDVADVANDNNLAIAIGNFSQEPLSLYTQTGQGQLFQDRAGVARLTRPSLLQLTFGLLFADLDLDGFSELITINGHIEPEINTIQQNITFAQKPQIFYNDKGIFVDISDKAGDAFSKEIVGRGIASADIDQDGDLDILVTVNGGSPSLLRNDSKSTGNYLQLEFEGKKPNVQAIGAKVEVWSNGMKQQKMVRTGSSFLTQSDASQLIFGLGDSNLADSVVVHWPAKGSKKVLKGLAGGKHSIAE